MPDSGSIHYYVKGSGNKSYTVTINYNTGHWCTCRGMISKKKTYGEDSGRTQGTSCKHIKTIINREYDGDWGKFGGRGKPRTRTTPVSSTPTMPTQPTGRRAAIMAQRAKREKETYNLPLIDRIAALEAAREGSTG